MWASLSFTVRGRHLSLIGLLLTAGMRDDLSDLIVETFEHSNQPISLKFVAYGNLVEVSRAAMRRLRLDSYVCRRCHSSADELWRTNPSCLVREELPPSAGGLEQSCVDGTCWDRRECVLRRSGVRS